MMSVLISILISMLSAFFMAGVAGGKSSAREVLEGKIPSKNQPKEVPVAVEEEEEDVTTSEVPDVNPPETNDTPVSNPVEEEDTPTVAPVDTTDPVEVPVQDETPTENGDSAPVQDEIAVQSTEPVDEPVTDPSDAVTQAPPVQSVDQTEEDTSIEASDNLIVLGGRANTLDLGDDVANVNILNDPSVGNLTVNPDNTLALVLTGTDHTGPLSFSYEVSYTDGSSTVVEQNVDVQAMTQSGGWGIGDHYMLETDENGDLIVEAGENHRTVHVSNSDTAITKEDIAALEGLEEDDINQAWLLDNPIYGSTPEMALAPDAGMPLWFGLIGSGSEPGSHHLLFERGYEYNTGRFIQQDTHGESELNPIYVGAYGEGDRPLILKAVEIYQTPSSNVVIDGLELNDGMKILGGENFLINDTVSTHDEFNIQNTEGFTLRDSSIYDVFDDDPAGTDSYFQHADRISGLFAKNNTGLLLENNFIDHVGWEDGYDYNRSAEDGQPPSMYSQNIYIQRDNIDVTFRDNISMRAASFGAQVRSGGFIEDNVFIDNNAGVNFLGGEKGEYNGNYTLLTDNLVTSGASKRVDVHEGARTLGINDGGKDSTLLDNIVTHLANPDDPDEFNSKESTHAAVLGTKNPYYDDTIIYNWVASDDDPTDSDFNSPDTNIDGLDTDILDQTTIQNFTAGLLGKPDATISDLADYLRAQANGELDGEVDADVILNYFQQGFGMDVDIRTQAETVRFVPDDLGDGIRWDNRLNWSTEDLPGSVRDDSVDMAGNWVHFGGTATIENLDMGGGKLTVNNGALKITGTVETGEDGAELDVNNVGQIWFDGLGADQMLDIDVSGGRLANLGDIDGNVDIDVTGGQAILAVSGGNTNLTAGSSLTIYGSDGKVGFDGDDGGVATVQIEDGAQVNFITDEDGVSGLREFRSGHFEGDTPDMVSGIDLGGGVLGIDLTGLQGMAMTDTLFEADEIIGNFDQIKIMGLSATQDAKIIFDYDSDTVSFSVTGTSAGSGNAEVEIIGDMFNAEGHNEIWEALTAGQPTYSETDLPDIALVDDLEYASL